MPRTPRSPTGTLSDSHHRSASAPHGAFARLSSGVVRGVPSYRLSACAHDCSPDSADAILLMQPTPWEQSQPASSQPDQAEDLLWPEVNVRSSKVHMEATEVRRDTCAWSLSWE